MNPINTWKIKNSTHGCCVNRDLRENGLTKVAAFDLDFTLVKPNGNAKFPKDADDWIFINDAVVPKLCELHEKGFVFVVFSNQGGIEKGKTTHEEF